MSEKEPKLGDVIDDYCSRCRLIMNHGIVSIVEGGVRRVRCNTCMNEHAYRHAKVPKKKGDTKDLFDQVLASIPDAATSAAPARPARRRTPHLRTRSTVGPDPEEPPAPPKKRRRKRGKKR